jgi:hypothetical protein
MVCFREPLFGCTVALTFGCNIPQMLNPAVSGAGNRQHNCLLLVCSIGSLKGLLHGNGSVHEQAILLEMQLSSGYVAERQDNICWQNSAW